jgi:flagellar biosynthesis chaperone FliJ
VKRSRIAVLIRLAQRDAELALRALGQVRAQLEAHEANVRQAEDALRQAEQRVRMAIGPGKILPTAALVSDARARAALEARCAQLVREGRPLHEATEKARAELARRRLRVRALEHAQARRDARERMHARRREVRRMDERVRELRAREEAANEQS